MDEYLDCFPPLTIFNPQSAEVLLYRETGGFLLFQSRGPAFLSLTASQHDNVPVQCGTIVASAGPTSSQHWSVITVTGCSRSQLDGIGSAYRRLGAKGSYLTLVRVADRIL